MYIMRKPWFLRPRLMACLLACGYFLLYLLAVYMNHVDPFFPYISSCGTDNPEQILFSIIQTTLGITGFFFHYIRYAIYKQYLVNMKVPSSDQIFRLLWFYIYAAGISYFIIVQVGALTMTKFPVLHYLLGHSSVAGTLIVFTVDVMISCVGVPDLVPLRTVAIRAVLTFSLILLAAITLLFIRLGYYFHAKSGLTYEDEPMYTLFALGSAGEWIILVITLLYHTTFEHEFRKFDIGNIKIIARSLSEISLRIPKDDSHNNSSFVKK